MNLLTSKGAAKYSISDDLRGSTMTATIYAGERPKPSSEPVVLKADRMVDVVERVLVEPGVVVVEGDRIRDVGPERIPDDARGHRAG